MRDQNSGSSRVRQNPNNVIITILVEPTTRSQMVNREADFTNQIGPNSPLSRPSLKNTAPINRRRTRHGYDRRAELLAQVRELRGNEAGRVQNRPMKSSRPKPKKWRWASRVPAKIRATTSFLGAFRWKHREWCYDRISEETEESTKKQPSTSSKFCRKLKKLLIRLSCELKCYKV